MKRIFVFNYLQIFTKRTNRTKNEKIRENKKDKKNVHYCINYYNAAKICTTLFLLFNSLQAYALNLCHLANPLGELLVLV